MELKIFIGENRNNGDKGVQSAGENIYFGTVVPDHIGDNYAFIHSCAIIGGKLVLGMDKQPTNIDTTKVTIGGIDTTLTWDGGKNEFTGTPNQKLIDLFSMVGGNTDSIGDVVPPVGGGGTPTPPTLTGLTLTGSATGAEGGSGQLSVAPVPSGATLPTITYVSDDTSVATVNATGKVTFIKGGWVTFTATGGGKTASLDGETTNTNATTMVSAEVPVGSGGWHVDVTLSDDKGYGSDTPAWELKVNGAVRKDIFVTGHDTTKFQVRFVAGTDAANLIKNSDVVLVSHTSAEGGVAKFIDKPVTNNLP